MAKTALLPVMAAVLLLGAGAAPPKKPANSSQALAAILEDYGKHQLEISPFLRIQKGLDVVKLPDLSFEGGRKEAAFLRALRERLARVDPEGLTHEEWLSREILDWEIAGYTGFEEHFWAMFQVTPYSSPLRSLRDVFDTFTFDDDKDLPRYLDLLQQYARSVDQLRANLETQRSKGILLPKAEIDPVVGMVRSLLLKPEESFFAVSSERLAKIDPKKAAAFQAEVLKRVQGKVNPALEALAAVPDSKDYREAAPDKVGMGQYPGGNAAYRYLVRLYTTMDVQPEQVHQQGLQEVARLNRRLDEVRQAVKFEGGLAKFREFLKSDPRFFVKTPEEVAERLMAPVRRIEPRIGEFFLRTPKAPYGVERLEPELEGAVTYGYYRPPTSVRPRGDYMFNGSRLGERSMLGAAALIYHELLPGHHFQIALQAENESLPEFRRVPSATAFVEGWAMYSSGLAEQMEGYTDPYDLAGWIAHDLFLSSRLVVDTGMNALGWSRHQAMDFMAANTFESATQIETETLRYSADIPGQALAYKMGSNKFWELRRKAERELGAKFDVRRFHEAVLGSGAMPMTVLEKHVEWWIGEEKKR
ncbi:MAG TPA: DUF885 domain-containing protein [Thermoanaerobaculia bacterium]